MCIEIEPRRPAWLNFGNGQGGPGHFRSHHIPCAVLAGGASAH